MSRRIRQNRLSFRALAVLLSLCLLAAVIFTSSCRTLDKPTANAYYAEAVPPARSELRWSNGKAPKSFDPALAEAPPETDIVRAIYEGLTTIDPKTLTAVPGIAEKWSSADNISWTFQLRKDAKWTNGKSVVARDFVRSWNRLAVLGDAAAHSELLANFAREKAAPSAKPGAKDNEASPQQPGSHPSPETAFPSPSPERSPADRQPSPSPTPREEPKSSLSKEPLAVKAEGDTTLSITLVAPDPDLPKMLANPIFSPVFSDGSEFESGVSPTALVTNGPFRVASVDKNGLLLTKSDSFFDRDSVELDSVRLIPAETAEDALEAYRSGAVDVLTNAEFEPAALKLLAPYEDFRRTTHGALNLYEFNRSKPPFSDRRVREALSISIERERLTEGELEGSTRPALRFLPFGGKLVAPLTQDADHAQELMAAAGYPDGEGFPIIKLVINRNDIQQRIAKAVARMWKQNLNVDTEVIVKEPAEIAAVRTSGDFDLIRRGIVFPTSDPQSNLAVIFSPEHPQPGETDKTKQREPAANKQATPLPATENRSSTEPHQTADVAPAQGAAIPTEADALYDFPAIPLYFPTSYCLVKPYVHGFEPNGLDLFILDDVSIDSNWQPKRPNGES